MTAILIMICLLCGLSSSNALAQHISDSKRIHWNAERGYGSFVHSTSSGLLLNDTTEYPLHDSYRLEKPSKDFCLRFMAANLHNHPSKSYTYFTGDGTRRKVSDPSWGFYIVGSRRDSLIFTVKTIEQQDALSSRSVLKVSAGYSLQKLDLKTETLSEGVDFHEGYNIWCLSAKNGIVTLLGGNRGLENILSFTFETGDMVAFGFVAMSGACLKVCDISFSNDDIMTDIRQTSWSNPDHLQNYLRASKDTMEGYWIVFDRNLEESYLQLGGDYRFAMVKDGADYLLIYLDGARVNAAEWKPGMVKARFTSDSFPGIYSVEWFDSQGKPLSNSIKAQEEDGNVLSIQFPYNSSSLRLRRLP